MILKEYSNIGTLVSIETSKEILDAEVIKKPFYDPNKKIVSSFEVKIK